MSLEITPPSASNDGLGPSNRSTNPPETMGTDLEVGPRVLLDTIRFHGPVSGHCIPDENIRRHTDTDTGEITDRPVSTAGVPIGPGVMLKVNTRNGQDLALMEFSVPKMLTGSNLTAATVPETLSLVQYLYDEASHTVDWNCEPTDLTVTRLDLVRDFKDVEALAPLLDGLSRVPVVRTGVDMRYVDPERGGAQTLRRGVGGRWMATLYDKHAQMLYLASREPSGDARDRLLRQAAAAEGALRFEVGLRRDPLRSLGIETLSDLTDEVSLAQARLKYFNRAQYNQEVGGMDKVEQVLREIQMDEANKKKGDKMIAILMRDAIGLPQVASKETVRKHKALARQYGLTAADLTVSDRPTIALDYQSGTLRRAA